MSLPALQEREALPRHRGWTRQSWPREGSERPQAPWWHQIDLGLLTATLALCSVGWLALYSASSPEAYRQALFMAIGLVMMGVAWMTDYRWWARAWLPLFGVSLGLLALVMVPGIGQAAKGAQRWISLGPLAFQPSELAKLALVVALARVFEKNGGLLRLAGGLVLTGLAFVLIALQPDLGTALVLGAICLMIAFLGGASPVYLLGLVTGGSVVLPHVLKEYQRNRLMIFLNPDLDPRGLGYSLVQSKTAIGSGQLWGKGLFAGHMTQHGFVPENWTDFIFSAIGEELGFFGCLGFLLLALVLCGCLVRVAWGARDRFGLLLTAGVLGMLSFQFLVNMAMTTGAAPVVGIPLPFASYGGSALMVNLLSLGIVGSVSFRSRAPRPPWEGPETP